MKTKSTNKTLVCKIFFVYLTCFLIFSTTLYASTHPPIFWFPDRIHQTLVPGVREDLTLTFISSLDLKNVKLWVVPELQPFMSLEPSVFTSIKANNAYNVTIHLLAPMSSRPGRYDGTIHLKVGSRTYPQSLKVVLDISHVENFPPVANAGPDKDVTVGETVTLDGRNSYDPENDPITYSWAITKAPSGSTATLNNPASVTPILTPDAPGEYRISLTVSDGEAISTPDEVVIIATMPNVAPTANAGPDQSVVTGSTVFLDGRGSFDPDGDPITYQWQILSRPQGSIASLDDSSSATPAFKADKVGQYTILLTVNDGKLNSLPDDVIVISAIPNAPPVSYAGDDQTVSKNSIIQLDGRGSNDPNNDPLTYSWLVVSRPSGSNSELNDFASPTPQILADKIGEYVFRLIVFDGELYSDPNTDGATVLITVVNDPPIANAGPDQDGVVGFPITLNGSGSSDPNGDTLTYLWTIGSAPGGNSAPIVNPTSVTPIITPNVPGAYVIQLMVNDGNTDSSPDTVTLIVKTTVPDVVNQPQALAETAIISAGLSIGAVTQTYSAVPVGYVVSQNPVGGTLALAGSSVTLTISQGPALVPVPNVVGMTQSAAGAAILAAGLQVGAVTTANSPTVPAGSVISQNPSVGSSVSPGSPINLVVSLGPVMVTVPNVVGMAQGAAQSAIVAAGLTVGAVNSAPHDTIPLGSVISQNPVGGSSIAQGSSVDLVISLGPQGPPLPPDPAAVAPPVDPTVPTTVPGGTQFLYTGNNPIQTGVASNTIDPKRVAVLRGKVMTRDGSSLSGVTITILNHSEYGQTLSRADGMFDMAVNGGESITVNYVKTGYLSAQRQVSVPLQDFAWLPEVILLPKDSQVTTIDLTASIPVQVAQGSVVTDQDGSRQASLLIPQGTTADIVLPNGNTQPLTSLNVRITEFSVGPAGPKSMPAELPPNVGYTYCVDLSVDQADALGASRVLFSQPIFHYVENFLGFPVGMIVPAAYYDRERGAWVPSKNGRVIKILSIQGGLAELDTDGDGTADNGVGLGITVGERARLAGLYSAGQSLWRVPITHFSPWDFNWPSGLPESSKPSAPGQPYGGDSNKPDSPCWAGGSIIECESQILGERLGIVGTPFTLNYTSDRVPGRRGPKALRIPLLGQTIPSGLKYIELEIYVAGRKFTETLPALAGQAYDFMWDGKDAYGRYLNNGSQVVTIIIGYAYDSSYLVPGNGDPSFGTSSGATIPGIQARGGVSIWRLAQKATISSWDARSQGLGGWSLSLHHAYDPVGQILYLGNGRRRSVQSAGSVITTVAGTGKYLCERPDLVPGKWWCENQENILATETPVQYPGHVLVKPDGTFFTTDTWFFGLGYEGRVRYVNANGLISTAAGTWYCTPDGTNTADGIPATQACIDPQSLAMGPDGNLYIATGQRIRKVGLDGIITTIAGRYPQSYEGIVDGIPAIEANMWPKGIAFGSDRSLYFADQLNQVVRRIDPDGLITTVAGNGQVCSDWVCGDGGPATSAALGSPGYIAIAPDGSIYFTDMAGQPALRKVGPDGIIRTVLLGWSDYKDQLGRSWDEGIPAGLALAGDLRGIAFGPEGNLYVIANDDRYGNGNPHSFVRRIDTRGIITTIAGTFPEGDGGDGGPPTRAQFYMPENLGVAPDGSIYIADSWNSRVRRISTSLPEVSSTSFTIPSENATSLYDFDSSGRHVSTRHALTGTPLYQFFYDQNGYLIQIIDGSGNTTSIERDLNGTPGAIIAPYGQRTALSLDGNGYLSSVTNPASENFGFSYTEDGLLTDMSDPKGNPRHYTYDATGYLVRNDAPEGSFQTLSREDLETGHRVTRKTSLDRATTYSLEKLSTGQVQRNNTFPGKTQSQTVINSDGSSTVSLPDGTMTNVVKGGDPRFGMESPLLKELSMTTPGGLTYMTGTSRTVELSDLNNPLSVISITESVTTNGRTYINFYDASNRKYTLTTSEGRQSNTAIDTFGRMLQSQVAGLYPVNYSYDNRGRLITASVGTDPEKRTVSFSYGTDGYIEAITDPLERATTFRYDAAGRVVKKILPDLNEILFSYDANGNLTSITPPGRPIHAFNYTGLDLQAEYIPPDIGAGTNSTRYFYNADRQLTGVTRPDGQGLSLSYDPAGRLSLLGLPGGQLSYSYYASTGNLKSILDPFGGTLSFAYDGGLMTSQTWTGSINGSISLTYDNDFRVISQTISGTPAVGFSYDNDGLLIGAGGLNLSRSPQNGLITGTLIGNVSDAWTHNGFGEVESYSAAYSGVAFYYIQITYDKKGRITERTETIDGVTSIYNYTYDSVGRLTEVKRGGSTISQYTYDANGNRLSFTDGVATVTGSYDAQDRLLQYGNAAYTYSADGELSSKTISGQTTTFQYDVLGNLLSVTLPGKSIEYVVDGFNRRIGKKVNGTRTQAFLYRNKLNPVAELDGNNNVVSWFVYASRVNVPDYIIKSGTVYRIISDHLGSPRVVVNSQTGDIAQRMDFDEFGRVILDTNPGFQPFGFAGGLYDQDTGLTRFGARDYDAETGRWTAKDPILFQGGDSNLYAYVLSDPVNLIDPMGRFTARSAGKIFEYSVEALNANHTMQQLQMEHFAQDYQQMATSMYLHNQIYNMQQANSQIDWGTFIQENMCNLGTIPNGTANQDLLIIDNYSAVEVPLNDGRGDNVQVYSPIRPMSEAQFYLQYFWIDNDVDLADILP